MGEGPRQLYAIVAVCMCWWFLALASVRPSTLVHLDESWFLLFAGDDTGRLTHEVLHLRHEPPADPVAFLVGPSSTREAVTNARQLTGMLRKRSRSNVRAIDLTAEMLTPLEYAAILEAIPDGVRGVVVLTVSPQLLAKVDAEAQQLISTSAELRLGWVSFDRDAELERLGIAPPRRTGVYALDVRDFLLARVHLPLRRLVHGPIVHRRHRTATEPLAGVEDQRERYRKKLEVPATLVGLDVLERAMASLAARADVVFVLAEQTTLPGERLTALTEPGERAYVGAITAFAQGRSDTSYVDLNDVLVPEDFYDVVHLGRPRGKVRYTVALAAHLAPVIDRHLGLQEDP